MRFTTVSAAIALTLLSVSTSLYGQRPDDQVDPRSMALLKHGQAEKAAGKLAEARGTLETALAVDPRNRKAYIVLAEVARGEGLPGRAIRLYREALNLEPNDLEALSGQGAAMVSKGAVVRARENLTKIEKICGNDQCDPATQLSAAIAKGPPPVVEDAKATDDAKDASDTSK